MVEGAGEWRIAQARRPLLAELAYARIEEMIVTRRLPPGAMISENQIGEELGMGRTPVREALGRLKLIGFVEVHPRRGVLVSGVDVIRHLELLEVRRPLEERVVRSAAGRATSDDLATIRSLAGELTEAAASGDRVEYFRVKRMLHGAEVRAASNTVMSATMEALHAQSRRFWYTYEPAGSFAEGARLHGAVARHLVARDAEGAVRAVGALFDFLERLTRAALDRRPIA